MFLYFRKSIEITYMFRFHEMQSKELFNFSKHSKNLANIQAVDFCLCLIFLAGLETKLICITVFNHLFYDPSFLQKTVDILISPENSVLEIHFQFESKIGFEIVDNQNFGFLH